MTHITLDINSPTNDRTAHYVELTAHVGRGLDGEPELVDVDIDRIGEATPDKHPVAFERARETFLYTPVWRDLVLDAWENTEPDI